jgi:hypothetical protein
MALVQGKDGRSREDFGEEPRVSAAEGLGRLIRVAEEHDRDSRNGDHAQEAHRGRGEFLGVIDHEE